ncbi:MAG: L,D-transpeptidase [Spirulina sp.]
MKSPLLHRSQSFLAGTAIALTVSGVLSLPLPAFADRQPEPIAFATMLLETSQDRWIEVDLSSQRLIAREGRERVYEIPLSLEQTETPTGVFEIHAKLRSDRLDGGDANVSTVPVMYFHRNYALQGTQGDGIGTSITHDGINLSIEDATWLYDWSSVGTTLVIHK